ncbi:hypothetical protein PCANC_06100 [Puccinia coronata f. sp. avenae]|uniref:Mid2 domain-containing protein n=1 Tax=Puccinia coronata f. sp. avenae TaxID=200324 RepID=A0A2N5VTV5_9BASI|nr:hypothetical protein PCASD_22410 [Puccinia coronata f. sp. avenae]PLW38363.1 hypothetical protein PCASD_10575 [Puccinia coronata f. sp. avenae]PLW53416.1 hypothetical protein PCANC_06100 [Puccinia coronata f. sp. avenae]
MHFFSWLIYAKFCYLTYSSFNNGTQDKTQIIFSATSSLIVNGSGPRYGYKRPVLRLRQLPGSVQTVTATVTLTVTNTILPTTSLISSPPASALSSSLTTNFVSETPSLPDFVTATGQSVAPSSTLPGASLTTTAISSTPALPTGSEAPSLPSSTIPVVPTSTLVHSDSSLPTSVSSLQGASPSAVSNNSSGEANDESYRGENDGPRGHNRLVILCIVLAVICSLGLVIGFLFYLSPYLRDARLRRHAKSGSIFEDYSASARTFEPNPTGALNYQRSLSRKRNRRAHLVDAPGLPTKIPRPKTRSLDAGLWLPQTSAGPGLSRPAN